MAIRQQTIDKYTKFLKNFISEINKDNSISGSDFCKANSVSRNMITHVISLGFVSKVGDSKHTKYFPNLKVDNVEPRHGRLLAEKSCQYVTKYRSGGNSVKSQDTVSIKDFTTQELVKELKSRGFEGELNRIETIKI